MSKQNRHEHDWVDLAVVLDIKKMFKAMNFEGRRKKTYALRPTSQTRYRIGFVGHMFFIKSDEIRSR